MKESYLRKAYIKTIANIETNAGLVGKYDAADLFSLAEEGELLAIADVLYYLNKVAEGCESVFKNLKEEKKSQIRNYHIVKELKLNYLERENFLTGDEYLVLAEVVADENEKQALLYKAAKYYLNDLREYDNAFSGAMFLKTLSRSAESEGVIDVSKTELAKNIKNNLLWGNEGKRQALFINLISNVRKSTIKMARKTKLAGYSNAFAYAYAMDFFKNNKDKARNQVMLDLSI